jgi:hypothetical protein
MIGAHRICLPVHTSVGLQHLRVESATTTELESSAVLRIIPDEQPCYDLPVISSKIERIGWSLYGLTCLLFG